MFKEFILNKIFKIIMLSPCGYIAYEIIRLFISGTMNETKLSNLCLGFIISLVFYNYMNTIDLFLN